MNNSNPFKNLKADIPASVVVFFVALPLCLGIALASGAPLFSGVIAGIIGGIVVGVISKSKIGVSGPAAGLAAIVFAALDSLGSFENLLAAIVIAGLLQVVLGILRAGIIGYYFPSSVIKGMLTAIGVIIILKEIPHFFGYDKDPEGDMAFFQIDGENTFTEILNAVNLINPGATIIGFIALAILLLWSKYLSKKGRFFQIVQGPLVVVAVGIIYYVTTMGVPTLGIEAEHLVKIPVPKDFNGFLSQFATPNFAGFTNPNVLLVGFTIALVASLETLLCVEATDKIDPFKRVTPTNRELIAQGIGNVCSGLIGGLPVTQVIVRSSANIQSGGRTKMSAILHGFFLLIAVVFIPVLLNKIPLSVLAAVLLLVGYKLANPATFIKMYKMGWMQFIPFIVTVLAIVFTDLLVGVGIGLAVGILFTLFRSFQNSHFLHMQDKSDGVSKIKMTLAEEVTFFNKATILRELDSLPSNSFLELDVTKTVYLDHDVIEILDDFAVKAKNRNIHIKLISERGVIENPDSFVQFFKLNPKIKDFSYESTY